MVSVIPKNLPTGNCLYDRVNLISKDVKDVICRITFLQTLIRVIFPDKSVLF